MPQFNVAKSGSHPLPAGVNAIFVTPFDPLGRGTPAKASVTVVDLNGASEKFQSIEGRKAIRKGAGIASITNHGPAAVDVEH